MARPIHRVFGAGKKLERMVEESEKTHLEQLRKGSQESFRWIYDQHHPKVYGFCLKLMGSPPAAEEITSDVFIRLWEKRGVIDPAFPIGGLLFRITRDLAWNYLKKESRKARQQLQYVLEQQTSDAPNVESDLILKDYLAIAEAAINQLPEKRRRVFTLRYKTGLDDREIARQLNISEVTVRVHLSKATQFLRDYLKSHPETLYLVLLLAS